MAFNEKRNMKLSADVNRILFVRNLPYNITSDEMFDLFGKYGTIRQIRTGTENDTKGTAFVVYEDIFDAKNACEHLSGFNVAGRYLIVLYFNPNKQTGKRDLGARAAEVDELRRKAAAATSS